VGGDVVEYRGPRITISPVGVEECNHTVVGGVVVGAGGEYRSRGGSSTKKGDSNSGSMPSITVEFAD